MREFLNLKVQYLMVNHLIWIQQIFFSIDSTNLLDNIALKEHNLYKKQVAFDQDLIASFEKEPKDLTTLTIVKQIQFFER